MHRKLTGNEWEEAGASEEQGWRLTGKSNLEENEVCHLRKMLNIVKEKYAFS